MKLKITLDEEVCSKYGVSIQEALLALAIRYSDENTIWDMLNKEIVKADGRNDWYLITQHWSDVLDDILCDSSGSIDDEERLNNLAKQMRDCYPDGKVPGTAYYYKCNNREVALKLKKFFYQYGNYPDSKIIEATKRFVASFNGNYKYLPLIKYFISKNKQEMDEEGYMRVTQVSPLATYLENKEDSTIAHSDSWMMNVKN